jgi:steroid delta-isomerase-like uncharacterized protein
MSQSNKNLADRFHMDIFQAGNLDAAEQIVTRDFAWHGGFAPPLKPCGIDGVKQVAQAVVNAFPDRKIVHHEAIAEGDRVLIRWSMSGTHRGDLMGIPATGRQMTLTGFDYFRIENGKIAEMWQEADQLSMLQQLGVITPAQVGT